VVDRQSFDLEEGIDIDESNVDKLRAEKKPGVNYDDVEVNLRFYEDSDRDNYKNAYPGNKDVWIITHGYRDTVLNSDKNSLREGGFKDIATEIKKVYGDEVIILMLDWSDPAFGKDNGLSNLGGNRDVCRAATWIKTVSNGVNQRLNDWGFIDADFNNLNLVGHSLGSIMITELSKSFYSKSNMGIALDPPSENLCTYSVQGEYRRFHIPGSGGEFKNGEYRSDFAGRFRFVRAFVGRRSLAGNQRFTATADESLWFNYNKNSDAGGQHDWVVRSFRKLVDEIELKSSPAAQPVLDIKDQNRHASWEDTYMTYCSVDGVVYECQKDRYGGHDGSVRVNDPDDIQFLEVYVDNQPKKYEKY
jgi:hypothetical protein